MPLDPADPTAHRADGGAARPAADGASRATTARHYAGRMVLAAACFVIGAAIVGLLVSSLAPDRAFWEADRFIVAAFVGALVGFFEARRSLRRGRGTPAGSAAL